MCLTYTIDFVLQVKKDKLDGDLISKQIDMLYPQDMRESVKNGVTKCMPVRKYWR